MSNGPTLSRRARAVRLSMMVATTMGLVVIFPTWETFWCVVLLVAMWAGGTCAGIVVDEYWPRKLHSPRDFTSRHVTSTRARWR